MRRSVVEPKTNPKCEALGSLVLIEKEEQMTFV
jgi:hypothetical protein